jgi:hypothetical protein
VIYKDEDLKAARRSASAAQERENAGKGKKAGGLRTAATRELKVPALAIWGLQHNWLEAKSARCSIQSVLDEPILLAGTLRGRTIALMSANKIADIVLLRMVTSQSFS